MANKKTTVKNSNRSQPKYRGAARRSARSRKVRIIVFYSIIVAIVIAICISLSLTVLFKIVNVNVTGVTKYSSQDIINDSGIFVGENIFLCDQDNVSEKITQDFPYIESVAIDKKIPDTVTLMVKEVTPVGYVQYGDKYVVISTNGKVLEISDQPVDNLAVISGLEIQSAELAQPVQFTDESSAKIFNDICAELQNQGITDITSIDVSNHSNPKVKYQNRITIELGQPTDLSEKFKSAMAIINDPAISSSTKGTIDTSMSVSNNKTYFQQDYTS